MTDTETALSEELYKIAPDVELADIDRSGDLWEEYDIDSMDFLNLVTALGERFGIPMPEADYPQMRTFNDLARYLSSATS
jgi:acyl carrier protein